MTTPSRTLPAELALADELDAARRRDDGRLPPERELAARHGLSRTAPGFDECEVWDARLHAAIAASTANPLR